MAALTKLKRLSIMRQTVKPRTIGSGAEFDGMLAESGLTSASLSLERALSPQTLTDKEQTDEDGNPILGGELVVKVVDAQVCLTSALFVDKRRQELGSRAVALDWQV